MNLHSAWAGPTWKGDSMTTRGKRDGTVARLQAYNARFRRDPKLAAWFERVGAQAPTEPRSPTPRPEQTELFTGLPVTPRKDRLVRPRAAAGRSRGAPA